MQVKPSLEILEWRAIAGKQHLRGYLKVMLPSGLILHDCALMEKDGRRWIAPPTREWLNAEGKKGYTQLVTFRDRQVSDRFRELVLAALDEKLKNDEDQSMSAARGDDPDNW